jgi:AsmA protein
MHPWWRRSLYGLAAVALLLLGVALWLTRSFDGERVKRAATDWMQANHARALAFDGPVTLRFWPQPALVVGRLRLSEAGQPQQPFASIAEAALTLRLEPLLMRREIEVEQVSAKGVRLSFARDAEGRRNIDDLLSRAAGGGPGGAPGGPGVAMKVESVELTDAELQVTDAQAGVAGRFVVQRLSLGAFGPGLLSPVHLRAQAELTQPPLNAALVFDAGLQLSPAPQPGARPILRLDKTVLQLNGQGFDFEGLDVRLQADDIRLEDGPAPGLGDSHVDLAGVQLRFSGARRGWRVESGQAGLARLRLSASDRTLELERLALHAKGRSHETLFDTQLNWPALKVLGDNLQGGPVDGRVVLGGDQDLKLQLSSQAPSGSFEKLTLPALHAEIDGRVGPSTVMGRAEATLVLEPKPFAAALETLSLALSLSDPALPPLQLSLEGLAQLSALAGKGQFAGTVNDQRFEARVDAALDRLRPHLDVDASFGTLDLNRFVAPADRGAAPAPTDAATPVNLQALQSADARLRVKVARLLRPPYRIDGLELRAGITNGVLDLQRLAGRAWGGRFDASGSADAGTGRMALRLRADDVDLRTLLSDTVGFDGLRGRGRVEADLRSRGGTVGALRAAVNGRVVLALRPAAVRGLDLTQTLTGWRTASQGGNTTVAGDLGRQTEFSQLDASLDIQNGVGRSADLNGRSDFLNVTGEGTLDFVQGRIDYLLRARVVNTGGGRAGPEMVFLNGVTVPVAVQGPFNGVEWQVGWSAVTAGMVVRSVPNVARGALGATGGVLRGTGNVMRGAAGLVRGGSGDIAKPAPPPTPSR